MGSVAQTLGGVLFLTLLWGGPTQAACPCSCPAAWAQPPAGGELTPPPQPRRSRELFRWKRDAAPAFTLRMLEEASELTAGVIWLRLERMGEARSRRAVNAVSHQLERARKVERVVGRHLSAAESPKAPFCLIVLDLAGKAVATMAGDTRSPSYSPSSRNGSSASPAKASVSSPRGIRKSEERPPERSEDTNPAPLSR